MKRDSCHMSGQRSNQLAPFRSKGDFSVSPASIAAEFTVLSHWGKHLLVKTGRRRGQRSFNESVPKIPSSGEAATGSWLRLNKVSVFCTNCTLVSNLAKWTHMEYSRRHLHMSILIAHNSVLWITTLLSGKLGLFPKGDSTGIHFFVEHHLVRRTREIIQVTKLYSSARTLKHHVILFAASKQSS